MNLRRLFTEHPESVGETYLQHLCAASWFAARMFTGAIACFLHALLPFTFRRTGSECISELHEKMVMNRNRSATHGGAPGHGGAAGANAAR
ncbi:MAG: DUF6356 family protein [Gammaproteobacteria bacterium]